MKQGSTQQIVVACIAATGLSGLAMLTEAGGKVRPPTGHWHLAAVATEGLCLEPAAAPHRPAPVGESSTAAGPARELPRMTMAIGSDAQALGECFAASDQTAAVVTRITDRGAVELLLAGRAHFGVVALPLTDDDLRAGLRATTLGVELFALAVPTASPLRCLDSHQVRQVLTGAVDDWIRLGLPTQPVVVVGPADGQLATRAARSLVPGDPLLAGMVAVPDDRGVLVRILQTPGSIGVVRAAAAMSEPSVRLLAIDGVEPSWAEWRAGRYRAGVPITLVTIGEPAGVPLARLEAFRRDAEPSFAAWLTLPR